MAQPNCARGAAQSGKGPLLGLTFLNLRESGGAAALSERIVRLGGRVIEQPLLAFQPPDSWEPFDHRLHELLPSDWVVFTSATAVRFTLKRMEALGEKPAVLAQAHLAAIGSATAGALEAAGLAVELVPPLQQSEGLLEALLPLLDAGARVWLPRAQQARQVLEAGLAQAGVEVWSTPVYRTVSGLQGLGPVLEALCQGRVDWILFTSGSMVDRFLNLLQESGRQVPPDRFPRVACLGAVTAEKARQRGVRVRVVPTRQDLDGLMDALLDDLIADRDSSGRAPSGLNGA